MDNFHHLIHVMKLFNLFKEELTKTNRDKSLNVFSRYFNADSYRELVQKILEENKDIEIGDDEIRLDADYIADFIEASTILNTIFNNTYKALLETFKLLNATGSEIMPLLVAHNNRNDRVIYTKFLDKLSKLKGSYFDFDDMTNFKIESSLVKGSYSEARAALEGTTDALNMLLNYLKYYKEQNLESGKELGSHFASAIIYVMNLASIYTGIKNIYDTALYENGIIKLFKEDDKITLFFKSANGRQLMLKKAGEIMMQHQIASSNHKHISDTPLFAEYFSGLCISSCTNNNGTIELKIDKGDNKRLIECSKEMAGTIYAYYDYLLNVRLPKLGNAPINKVFAIWAVIQYISEEVLLDIDSDCDIFDRKDFNNVPQKISKDLLLDSICKLTKIDPDEVDNILDKFISKDNKRFYIWTSPLFDLGQYLLFPIFPIQRVQLLNLTDYILKCGGIDLKERGKWMEKYTIDHLNAHSIPFRREAWGARKFKGDHCKEEIDLLVNLKDLVIVGELKCIHYSMEENEYYNAWDRLRHGCEQAKRKADFLRRSPEIFSELGNYSKKDIVPVVVTNYPIYTGFCHEGIYVTDVHSLLIYLEGGFIALRSLFTEGDEFLAGETFFTDEDSYSSNFKRYLENNPLKEIIMSKMSITSFTQDQLFSKLTIKQTIAQYNNDPSINIRNGRQE